MYRSSIRHSEFCQAMDPKFQVRGRTAVETALKSPCEELERKVKENIQHAQRLTLCLDIWSKRGLMAAFLGISACLYNPDIQQGEHLTLNVFTFSHPHTGDMIAAKVSNCRW